MMEPTLRTDEDETDIQSANKDFLKSLQAREKTLEIILNNLGLDVSDFSEVTQNRITEMVPTLKNLGVSQPNNANIVYCHTMASMKIHEDKQHHSKLTISLAEMKSQRITCQQLISKVKTAIEMYKKHIEKLSADLTETIGPKPIINFSSHESEPPEQSEAIAHWSRFISQAKQITKINEEIDHLKSELVKFNNIPPDIEEAKQELQRLQREYERLCGELDDQLGM